MSKTPFALIGTGVVGRGAPEEVFKNPKSARLQAFLSCNSEDK